MPTTSTDDYRWIELITGEARRRHWTTEQKLQIIEESFLPGEPVSSVARRRGVAPPRMAESHLRNYGRPCRFPHRTHPKNVSHSAVSSPPLRQHSQAAQVRLPRAGRRLRSSFPSQVQFWAVLLAENDPQEVDRTSCVGFLEEIGPVEFHGSRGNS
ncbi:transposase (plasmid) [Mesorhizobium sp. AR07]|nr:transposase [Mesorhizobium sp. AR07]